MTSEEPDDHEKVPVEIQEKITSFIEETLFPAIRDYMKPKCPSYFKAPISLLCFGQFFGHYSSFEDLFTRKQWIELFKLKIALFLPNTAYLNRHKKALTEAAIRISKDIGKPEFEDLLKQIDGDYLKPKYFTSNFRNSQD